MTDKKDQKSSSKSNLNESTLPLLDSPPENPEKEGIEMETKKRCKCNRKWWWVKISRTLPAIAHFMVAHQSSSCALFFQENLRVREGERKMCPSADHLVPKRFSFSIWFSPNDCAGSTPNMPSHIHLLGLIRAIESKVWIVPWLEPYEGNEEMNEETFKRPEKLLSPAF